MGVIDEVPVGTYLREQIQNCVVPELGELLRNKVVDLDAGSSKALLYLLWRNHPDVARTVAARRVQKNELLKRMEWTNDITGVSRDKGGVGLLERRIKAIG
jgi:hypothetical protein